MLRRLRQKTEEYHSLILAILFVIFDGMVRATIFSVFRLFRVDPAKIRIRHLEIYLSGTTLLLVALILISFWWEAAGWLLVWVGSLRVLQIIAINAMTLLFGLRVLAQNVPDRDRARWHFVAILFSIMDVLLVYAFFYSFFNRHYGILNVAADRFFDHFYYAMMTLMTVGYGDIVPITPLGKFLALSETFVGVFLFVFLVNIAVNRYQRHLD